MEKYIKVKPGTTVKWRVYCDGYAEQSGIETLTSHKTLNIQLEKVYEVDLTNWAYSMDENSVATLTAYTGTETSITVPNIDI